MVTLSRNPSWFKVSSCVRKWPFHVISSMLGNGLIMSWLCGKNFVCGIILRQNRRDNIRGKKERKQ